MAGRVARALLCLAAVCLGCAGLSFAQQAAPASTGAAAVGTISGTVIDKGTGEPVIDAGVELVDQKKSTRTDLDGKYTFRVAPGLYTVRVFAAGFQAVRVQNIGVKAGEVARADATLAPSGDQAGMVVEVTATAKKAAETTQIVRRQKAAVVSETISAESIQKSGGGDASDVVQRAPAVTVRDQKFVYVRGLGERYSSALLNGSRLPSTEPEKRVVPLDLFPAGFLDALSIFKSYSPNLPGDFSGGLVDLELKDFPETLTYGLSMSSGANTQSTGQEFNTYEGSNADYVGYGDAFRSLPNDIPEQTLPENDERYLARLGRSFKDIWAVDEVVAGPNFGASFTLGNSWGPLGVQLAGTYSNEWNHVTDKIQRIFADTGDSLLAVDDYRQNISEFKTRSGAILTSAYKIDDTDKISLRGLYNHNSVDSTTLADGISRNNSGAIQQQTKFTYGEDSLIFGQLTGEHKSLPWLWVEWRSSYARSMRDEPDTRFLTYQGAPGSPPEFSEDSLGGTRLFLNLKEWETDDAVDFTIPFDTWLPGTDLWSGLPGRFKFGPAYTYRKRDFRQRRFRYRAPSEFFDLSEPPEELLAPQNIGIGGIQFSEESLPQDKYTVSEEIIAGYGMFELPIIRDMLRVIGGSRAEYSYINLTTFDQTLGGDRNIIKNNTNPMPSVSLVYSPIPTMNVRAGWSRTVSRPEFRELSPAFYPAPRGEFARFGNPNLFQTEVTNYDLRWEWFFGATELASLSFFYKDIPSPIELVAVPVATGAAVTYENSTDGSVIGIEGEFRKNFGFLSPKLENFSFLTNFTWADSEAFNSNEEGLSELTSERHALVGQSPFIVNAAIDYTHPVYGSARLLYFTAGRTLSALGGRPLPDIFEERRDQLDAVLSVSLKPWLDMPVSLNLGIENILNTPVRFTQGDAGQVLDRPKANGGTQGVHDISPATQQQFTSGTRFTLGISYTF